MRFVIMAISALALAGCQTDGNLAGQSGPPANYKQTILDNKNRLWKDPDSIKNASIAAPIPNGILPIWYVCVRLNAKNSYGGWAGEQDTAFMFRDDGTIEALPAGPSAMWCENKPHEPFPQLNGKGA